MKMSLMISASILRPPSKFWREELQVGAAVLAKRENRAAPKRNAERDHQRNTTESGNGVTNEPLDKEPLPEVTFVHVLG